jgi:hypothetical protein
MAADSQGKVRASSGSVIAARPDSGAPSPAPTPCSRAPRADSAPREATPCLHVHVPRV